MTDHRPHRIADPFRAFVASLSWGVVRESQTPRFRAGLPRDENLLTAEVFFGLDMLPRQAFLARVLRAVQGSERLRARTELLARAAEHVRFDVLPHQAGEAHAWVSADDGRPVGVKVDATLEAPGVLAAVECKGPAGRFNRRQIARQYVVVQREARRRDALPLWVAVLPAAPRANSEIWFVPS